MPPIPTAPRTEDSSVRGGGKKPSVSRSVKAGLLWPISRVHKRVLDAKNGRRVSAGAPVYVAAALQKIASELLAAAAAECTKAGRKRITPADLLTGIRADQELNKLTAGLTVLVGDRIKSRAASQAILSSADKAAKASS